APCRHTTFTPSRQHAGYGPRASGVLSDATVEFGGGVVVRPLFVTAADTVVVSVRIRRRGEPVGESRKRDILAGLAGLGPLPDDATVTPAQLQEFSDILAWIELAPPDPDYIRPLLNTFGYGDGFALYM